MSLSFTAARKRGLFDGMAIALSGMCMIHCLALPLVLTLLPTLSVARVWPEEIHIVAALLAAAACCAAIVPAWPQLTRYQRVRIGSCAILGLGCLLGSMTVHDHLAETVVTVIGSLFLIAAHVQNLTR